MDNLTDEQLIKNYLKGDSESLEILIKRYLTPIYNFVFYYVKNAAAADDVTQEVFVKVWKNLKKFKFNHKFKSWIFTIAKNTSLDYLKKNKIKIFSDLLSDENSNFFDKFMAEDSASPLELMEQADNAYEVNSALDKLPEKYKTTMRLYYQNGLKFREIADLLKESIDTIKTRHRRALIYLRKLMRKKE